MIRLQQLRLDSGYSVPVLAAKAKVGRQTIYRLEETGEAGHVASLHRIADVFGVQPSELLAPAVFPERGEAA